MLANVNFNVQATNSLFNGSELTLPNSEQLCFISVHLQILINILIANFKCMLINVWTTFTLLINVKEIYIYFFNEYLLTQKCITSSFLMVPDSRSLIKAKKERKKGFSLLHLIMHSILNIVLNRSLVRNPLMVRNKKTRGAWSLAERRWLSFSCSSDLGLRECLVTLKCLFLLSWLLQNMLFECLFLFF